MEIISIFIIVQKKKKKRKRKKEKEKEEQRYFHDSQAILYDKQIVFVRVHFES